MNAPLRTVLLAAVAALTLVSVGCQTTDEMKQNMPTHLLLKKGEHAERYGRFEEAAKTSPSKSAKAPALDSAVSMAVSANVKDPRFVGAYVGASLRTPKPPVETLGSGGAGVGLRGCATGGSVELVAGVLGVGVGVEVGSKRRHGSIGARKPLGGFLLLGAILSLIAMATEKQSRFGTMYFALSLRTTSVKLRPDYARNFSNLKFAPKLQSE